MWFTDEAVTAWAAELRTARGGQARQSPLAILTALTLRAVFRLAYRQAEGLLGSVIGLLGLSLHVPDHTTLMWTALEKQRLSVPLQHSRVPLFVSSSSRTAAQRRERIRSVAPLCRTLTPGESKATADFVTVYNFYGLVDGSVKSPAGWEFSSEEFGRTPTMNGYPAVLPVDVPNTPDLTWTVTKPVAAGAQLDGFTATTRVGEMMRGEYSAQVTHQLTAVKGAAAGTPAVAADASKQALIGTLPTPSFLAEVK